MIRHFVFCHGFGFDKSFWGNLAPYFTVGKSSFLDLGYFGEKSKMPIIEDGEILIGIGHSLGLTKLLNFNKKFNYLVGLNSFVDFCGNAPGLRDKRKEELELLQKLFVQDATRTLKRFYQRCGVDWDINKLAKLNKDTALKDLESLLQGYELNNNTPMLIIGSRDDVIVPEEILQDNFSAYKNVTIEIMDFGKHGLGWLDADKIQKKIKKFIHYAD